MSNNIKVIVLGIDGLTVDGIKNAKTPNIDYLLRNGKFTLKALAHKPTISSSNWMSMISSVEPIKHGVLKSSIRTAKYGYKQFNKKGQDYFPTIFTLLKNQQQNSKTALIYQWRGFKKIVNPKDIDYMKNIFWSSRGISVAGLKYFINNNPDLLFLHFDMVDFKGHLRGFKSEAYHRAIEKIDALIEKFVEMAINDSNIILFLVSDHGGKGYSHGGTSPEELTVPFVIYNNRFKAEEITKQVYNKYLAPTLASIFKLSMPECWERESLL